MSPDEIRAGLTRAGSARAQARHTAQTEMAEIERLVRDGDTAGLTKSEMAQLARVSRQTVHDILAPTHREQP